MRNWFIGMTLFVLTALVLSLNITNAAITSPYVQEKATSLFFHNEISSIAFNVIENDLESCCQNERNLVAFRNWVTNAAGNAAKMGVANSRALGIAGEQAVGVGSKTRIPSLTGTAKYRIPDQLTSTTFGEVKNVSHLSLTRQLTDFHMFSQQTGRQFILHTRPNTTFSGPLQNLINNGSIITKPIPFK